MSLPTYINSVLFGDEVGEIDEMDLAHEDMERDDPDDDPDEDTDYELSEKDILRNRYGV